MKIDKLPYRGTRDLFPKEKRIQNYLFRQMSKASELHGYLPYDGPTLESFELYQVKSGDELANEQLYHFVDKGNRHVAIRPEMTPTLARMVAQIYRETPLPIRWYSIPNLMRYERPQKGRLREHWQLNCDIFGAKEPLGEFEIIQVAITLFENLGATNEHFEIKINDRRLVDAFFHKVLKVEKEIQEKLYKIIDKSLKISLEDRSKLIHESGLDTTQIEHFNDYLNLSSIEELLSFAKKVHLVEETKILNILFELGKTVDISKYLAFSPQVIRGIAYYTGIVFEIFDKNPNNPRALCGGGSYANLLELFNEGPLLGVGFGLGDVTLTEFVTLHNLLPDFSLEGTKVVVTHQSEKCFNFAAQIARKLRILNIKTQMHPEQLKIQKAFHYCEKNEFPFVILIGEDELNHHTFQLKNLKTKEQKAFTLNQTKEIIEFIK